MTIVFLQFKRGYRTNSILSSRSSCRTQFQLNGKKTYLTEDVISDSIKPDKKAYISEGPIYRKTQKRIYSTMSNLQQEALFIYQFSKKHPNSGTLIKLLTTFAQRLNKKLRFVAITL